MPNVLERLGGVYISAHNTLSFFNRVCVGIKEKVCSYYLNMLEQLVFISFLIRLE